MEKPKYIIHVKSIDKEKTNDVAHVLYKVLGYDWQTAHKMVNNLPFEVKIGWWNEHKGIERIANDLRIAGATIHIEDVEKNKRTLRDEVGFKELERPIMPSTTYYNPNISEETKTLMTYLKDAFQLEQQLYTYKQIATKYEQSYDWTQGKIYDWETNSHLSLYEEYRGEVSNRSDNYALLRPEEVAKKYNIEDFYYSEKIPESWRQELGGILKGASSGGGKIFLIFLVFLFGGYIAGFFLCPAIAHWELSILERLVLAGIVGVIPAIILFLVLVFNGYFDRFNPKKKFGKTHEKFVALYEKKYNEALQEKKLFYIPKLEAQSKHLITEYKENVIPYMEQTQELLDKLYSKNFIHPKYRTMHAVGQIYEYFETGRCLELEGPDGAYNLYEHEKRLDRIADNLGTIISRLDELNTTMHMVVSAINYSNNLLSGISSSLGRIEANTALTAYNTQCIAYNTDIANRYNY